LEDVPEVGGAELVGTAHMLVPRDEKNFTICLKCGCTFDAQVGKRRYHRNSTGKGDRVIFMAFSSFQMISFWFGECPPNICQSYFPTRRSSSKKFTCAHVGPCLAYCVAIAVTSTRLTGRLLALVFKDGMDSLFPHLWIGPTAGISLILDGDIRSHS